MYNFGSHGFYSVTWLSHRNVIFLCQLYKKIVLTQKIKFFVIHSVTIAPSLPATTPHHSMHSKQQQCVFALSASTLHSIRILS
jgi:hypothetical protein